MTAVYPIKCRIRAEAAATRVDVYDDIGEGWFTEGVTAKNFAAQLATVKGALDVHINSGGGDVFDGIAIASALRAYKGRVTTTVDGLAASIASVIAQAGQERVVASGSMMMIHDAFGCCVGNAGEMTKMAGTLDQVSDNIAGIYASRSGRDAAAWRAAMKDETWYTAEEAVAAGLADKVSDGTAELPAGLDVAAFTSLPGRIAARLRSMPVAASPDDARDGARKCETCGGTGLQPPPDDDGQDDPDTAEDAAQDALRALIREGIAAKLDAVAALIAAGGDPAGALAVTGAAGAQPQDVPGKPAGDRLAPDAIRALMREEITAFLASVDNSDWDASKAWHNGAESDDPAAFYAGICAGKKAGDKATQDAWALPYKYAPSSPPNAAGVKNALSRLPQTDGLTNEAEAKALLQRLMKQVNPDYEPEDHDDGTGLSGIDLEQLGNQLSEALKGALA